MISIVIHDAPRHWHRCRSASTGSFGKPTVGGRGPLVVVAGLPGAGKTTALRALAARDIAVGLVVLDPSAIHQLMLVRLGRIPYGAYRPVVHIAHWMRIVVLALTGSLPLVVHETATRPVSRWLLRRLARLARRPARLVWLETASEIALTGQVSRGRTVKERAVPPAPATNQASTPSPGRRRPLGRCVLHRPQECGAHDHLCLDGGRREGLAGRRTSDLTGCRPARASGYFTRVI